VHHKKTLISAGISGNQHFLIVFTSGSPPEKSQLIQCFYLLAFSPTLLQNVVPGFFFFP